jgi:23S rRNA pseudouridine1911/1915/1917 synthase
VNDNRLHVLYEDNHLLAVVKPAGLATMGVKEGTPSLLNIARQYIKDRYQKPGNVYLGAMSRLDVPVSGVVLSARTSKAAARLTEQFRTRKVEKLYWALVEGRIEPDHGAFVDWLAEDERHKRMRVVGPQAPGAREARLTWRRFSCPAGLSHVEVSLETGRKHQIRLQFAHHGHPILGDRKYGARGTFPGGIALHARRLFVQHPVRAECLEFEAPPPLTWWKYLMS